MNFQCAVVLKIMLHTKQTWNSFWTDLVIKNTMSRECCIYHLHIECSGWNYVMVMNEKVVGLWWNSFVSQVSPTVTGLILFRCKLKNIGHVLCCVVLNSDLHMIWWLNFYCFQQLALLHVQKIRQGLLLMVFHAAFSYIKIGFLNLFS